MILHERGNSTGRSRGGCPELAKVRVKTADGETVPLAKPITYRDLFRHTAGFAGYDGLYHQDGFWGHDTRQEARLDNRRAGQGVD